MVAALKLTFFVLRFLLVMAGVAVLIDRTEGGIEVGTYVLFACNTPQHPLPQPPYRSRPQDLCSRWLHSRVGSELTSSRCFSPPHGWPRTRESHQHTSGEQINVFSDRARVRSHPLLKHDGVYTVQRVLLTFFHFPPVSVRVGYRMPTNMVPWIPPATPYLSRQDLSDPGFPLTFANAVYMSAMLLTTVGEGGYGPVPVSPYLRCAAAAAVLLFLPLAAVRVRIALLSPACGFSTFREHFAVIEPCVLLFCSGGEGVGACNRSFVV